MKSFEQAHLGYRISQLAGAHFTPVDGELGQFPTISRLRNVPGVPSMFSGLNGEQQAVDEALEHAFKVHDFGALYDTLDFLKFSRSNTEAIVNLVATAAGFVAGVGAVVAAVQSISEILRFLGVMDYGDFDIEAAFTQLNEQVNTIYAHLAAEAEDKRIAESEAIRTGLDRVQRTVDSASTTGLSPDTRDDLKTAINHLDAVLDTMLTVSNARIPFSPASYASATSATGWTPWYEYAGTPYLTFGSGAPTQRLQPLVSRVWDPGHYVAALALGIRLRIAAGTTLEPLYRTTGYRRPAVDSLAPRLRAFIDQWQDSLWVANPSACIAVDGRLLAGWNGILVGAVCPVTGLSSLRWFGDFATTNVVKSTGVLGLGTSERRFYATNPTEALHAALVQHQIAVQKVKRGSGIGKLTELHDRLRAVSGPPTPTESVHFGSIRMILPPTAVVFPGAGYPPEETTTGLGELSRWAADPDKVYPATRHYPRANKVLSLSLGRRSRASQVRTGYRVRIAGEVIDIQEWNSAPAPEATVDWFPTEPIERSITLQTRVYDCVQLRALTTAEEEAYDEGEVDPAPRLLINERMASVTFQVVLNFSPLRDQESSSHLGEVEVTVVPQDALEQPHAYVLDIDVLETHVERSAEKGKPATLEETTVDGVSLHIVPSWLRVSQSFFDDYEAARARMFDAMVKTALESRHLHKLSPHDVPKRVDPRPKFTSVQDASAIAIAAEMFRTEERSPSFAAEVQRFLLPGTTSGTG